MLYVLPFLFKYRACIFLGELFLCPFYFVIHTWGGNTLLPLLEQVKGSRRKSRKDIKTERRGGRKRGKKERENWRHQFPLITVSEPPNLPLTLLLVFWASPVYFC
jgi:hypothetical protein